MSNLARFALCGLLLVGCDAPSRVSQTHTFASEQPITEIRADVEHGAVTVIAADVSRAEVIRDVQWYGRGEPRAEMWTAGGVLHIDFKCRSDHPLCHADHTIRAPASVRVAVTVGRGDVEIEGTHGDVDVEAGSGDIELHQVSGDLSLKTGAGEVDGTDLRSATADVETGAGEVDLYFSGEIARVEIFAGAGDIDLEVPAGAYQLDIAADAGDVDVEDVSHDSGAEGVIIVDSSAGDVDIEGR
ncbi:MAG: DUF4097 family beta strand repeat-containing protein [Myxococcota bacterium]